MTNIPPHAPKRFAVRVVADSVAAPVRRRMAEWRSGPALSFADAARPVEFDRERLREYYRNRGYYDFRVSSAVAELREMEIAPAELSRP